MNRQLSLAQFVGQVRADCLVAISSGSFCHHQKELLNATMRYLYAHSDVDDWGQPLGLFYAVYRICGGRRSSLSLQVARFVAFYIASADLFDDVQDEDLVGKPHADAGPAVAINSALSLLSLALDALGEASETEPSQRRRQLYLRLFNRVSLVAVGAQHRDLTTDLGPVSRAEVEAIHRGKTSSLALLCEVAALSAGASDEARRRFFCVGEELAAAVQVIDDIRDLVADEESVDLRAQTATYPLACFFERATHASTKLMMSFLREGQDARDQICSLLEGAGVFDQCALAVESHRKRIYSLLREGEAVGPYVKLLTSIVDQLAGALYLPEPIENEVRVNLEGSYAQVVHRSAQDFAQRTRFVEGEALPRFVPWHMPIFLYRPDETAIYFSDMDQLPEEVLPFHERLLGDHPSVREELEKCVPFVVAHELVHAWRDRVGLLSSDSWHEEYVANAVALSYVARFEPRALRAVVKCSRLMLLRTSGTAFQDGALVKARDFTRDEGDVDYDCSPEEAALIHARMILELNSSSEPLELQLQRWLKSRLPLAAE